MGAGPGCFGTMRGFGTNVSLPGLFGGTLGRTFGVAMLAEAEAEAEAAEAALCFGTFCTQGCWPPLPPELFGMAVLAAFPNGLQKNTHHHHHTENIAISSKGAISLIGAFFPCVDGVYIFVAQS